MTVESVFLEVQQVCAGILRVPEGSIQMPSRFVEDLNVDSLFLAELAMGLEQQFNIEIPETDTMNIRTVGEMTEYIYVKKCA